MNILSFTYWEGCHDTAAALVCDGTLVAAAEEERFSRRKHEGDFPFCAIEYCLRRAGISMDRVDMIAFPDKPFRSGPDSQIADIDFKLLRQLRVAGVLRKRSLIHKHALDAGLALGIQANLIMRPAVKEGFTLLRGKYGAIPPVRYYEHHHAHAASAYLTSGLKEAAIAVIDGRGGMYASTTWIGRGSRIQRMRAEPFTNSLGYFYRDCTRYVGLGDFSEGKLMGLAAYGDKNALAQCVSGLLDLDGVGWYRYGRPPETGTVSFPRRRDEEILQGPYEDFAAAVQSCLERAVERVAESALSEAGSGSLCLAGGVAMNCASNGAFLRSGKASEMWVVPASGDAGLPIGSALLAAIEAGEFKCQRLATSYWGPEFSDEEIEASLRSEPEIRYNQPCNLIPLVAARLAAGQVVGWFQGRMELGPRALGNRSILADPRSVAMRDRVNKLKGRELWRPLAPVVPEARASEFFDLRMPSPFMLFAVPVRDAARKVLPAIVHVDGTARPQTATPRENPELYELLHAFEKLTGIPVLINTSFNVAAEPIVCTPGNAVATFLKTKLDVLVLNNFLVERRRTEESPNHIVAP